MRLSLVLASVSILRQGVRAEPADGQAGRHSVRAPVLRFARFGTVQYLPTYPVFADPPCRCFVVRCTCRCSFSKAEGENGRRIEPGSKLARSVRAGERSKVEPFTDRRGPKGLALCAVRAWSTGASPLAHPIAPGLARGAWGKHRQAPGAEVALS